MDFIEGLHLAMQDDYISNYRSILQNFPFRPPKTLIYLSLGCQGFLWRNSVWLYGICNIIASDWDSLTNKL